MIRWEDIDHIGSDHGLAIDDFTIEANPVDLIPPTVTTLVPANGTTTGHNPNNMHILIYVYDKVTLEILQVIKQKIE